MKLAIEDLETLAKLYNTTTTQLLGPPDAAELVKTLDSVQGIVENMDKATLAEWLSLGRKLAGK